MSYASLRPGKPAAVIVAALALLVTAAPALAGWTEDYKDGLDAYKNGKTREAIQLLRAAISKKDQEKPNAVRISGMYFDPYLPHFYLGMALFKAKQYEQAIKELETSESMGAIQKYGDRYAQLQRTKPLAAGALEATQTHGPQTPPGPGPGPGPTKPSQEETKPQPGPQQPPPPTRIHPQKMPGPVPAELRQRAEGEVAAAAKFTAQSAGELDPAETRTVQGMSQRIHEALANGSANEVESELSKLRGEMTSLQAKVSARKKQRAGQEAVDAARKRAAPVISDAEAFANTSGAKLENDERADLERAIASAKNAGTPEAMRGAAGRLQAEVSKLKGQIAARAAADAGASLKDQYATGVTAYFEGRYDDAVASLTQAAQGLKSDPGPDALLGAALYKQYLLGHPRDEQLKSQAEQSFRAALSIQADYKLDERYFPPKVVAFFEHVSTGR